MLSFSFVFLISRERFPQLVLSLLVHHLSSQVTSSRKHALHHLEAFSLLLPLTQPLGIIIRVLVWRRVWVWGHLHVDLSPALTLPSCAASGKLLNISKPQSIPPSLPVVMYLPYWLSGLNEILLEQLLAQCLTEIDYQM